MSNENSSSRKNSLLTVVFVLWLAGLTALFFMLIKNQKDNPLEARIAKLEAKTSRVVGKIKKPGSAAANNDIAMLNQRISQLELKLGEIKPGSIANASVNTPATVAAAATATTGSDKPCDCNEFTSRLDKLEAALMAQNTGTGKITAAAYTTPKPRVKKSKPVRKSRKKAIKRSKRRTPRRVKTIASVSTKPINTKRTAFAKTESTYDSYEEKDHIGDSVYEMSRRFGPMYGGYSSDELASISRLAPGAAIYPGSSIGNYEKLTEF